jgi:glycosyltransferase involved in cell wall biosynthesis
LVCAGEFLADFKREKARWDGTFTHYPALTHSALAALLRECSAFVLPSNEEGFARAIIEAMGSGLPIIATHQSGATTLVENEVHGLIVNGRNIDELASAMLRLAKDTVLNEKMGKAAYQRGARLNSWGDYAERLLTIYTKARENRLRIASDSK